MDLPLIILYHDAVHEVRVSRERLLAARVLRLRGTQDLHHTESSI